MVDRQEVSAALWSVFLAALVKRALTPGDNRRSFSLAQARPEMPAGCSMDALRPLTQLRRGVSFSFSTPTHRLFFVSFKERADMMLF